MTINAFSMGAWAAGFNMSLGMLRHGIVKSIGPDLDKILSTLEVLGPSYRFLISGYPPFLKHLLDEGERRGFPWADYELHALVGGEGMTEELRDILLERFVSVYSGYGATDIEIGMAGESPVSIAVRRLARARPDIGRALFGTDSRLPMVFQYNPLIHFMEVNAQGEVICTVSRLDLLAPRIRYNVHDSGGIVPYEQVRETCADSASTWTTWADRPRSTDRAGRCPGRDPSRCRSCGSTAGATRRSASWGPTSTPRTSSPCCTATRSIAPRLHSFMLSVVDDATGTPRPAVALELTDLDGIDDAWRLAAAERVRDGLSALNLDYRSSVGEFPGAMLPLVSTHPVEAAVRSPATPRASSSVGSPADSGQSRRSVRSAALTRSSSVLPTSRSLSAARDASRASPSE